jgi:hypothetical protein
MRYRVKPWAYILAAVLFGAGFAWTMSDRPVAYLHELGHCFFAYITGGGGTILDPKHALTAGGWELLVGIGGWLFTLLLGAGLVLLSFRRGRIYLGAYFFGMGHGELVYFPWSVDQRISGMSTTAFIVFVIVLLAVLWGLVVWRWKKKVIPGKEYRREQYRRYNESINALL